MKNIISEDNIKVAVKSLARGSSAGVDGMPLELYLDHLDEMAPALSALFEQLLERGRLTETMLSARYCRHCTRKRVRGPTRRGTVRCR